MPAMPPAQSGGPSSLKLRQSCDSCSLAKVKCSRAHPCARCARHGEPCVYGVSRKHGKPPAHRNSPYHRPARVNSNHMPQEQSMSQQITPFDSCEDFAVTTNDDLGPIMQQDWSPDFPTDPQTWSGLSLDQLITPPFTTHDRALWDGIRLRGNNLSELTSSSSGSIDVASCFGAPSPSLDDIYAFPNSSSHPPILSAHPEANRTHDCSASASNLLATLNHQLGHYSHASGDNFLFNKKDHDLPLPPELNLRGNSARGQGPTFDKILNTNQVAIEKLTRLLTCDCARNPHLAILYASLIFRILAWYQVAGGLKRTGTTSAPPELASYSPHALESFGSLPPFMSDAAHTTVVIGSFKLEESQQHVIRQQLLQAEVQKLGKLIETYTRVITTPVDDRLSNLTHFGSMAAAWLNAELGETTSSIQHRTEPARGS